MFDRFYRCILYKRVKCVKEEANAIRCYSEIYGWDYVYKLSDTRYISITNNMEYKTSAFDCEDGEKFINVGSGLYCFSRFIDNPKMPDFYKELIIDKCKNFIETFEEKNKVKNKSF